MKIMMITVRFPPALGGTEKHVFLISRELMKRGNMVTVYTTNSMSIEDTSIIKNVSKMKLSNILQEENIESIKIKRFEIFFRYWSFLYVPELFRRIRKDIHEFDIIHSHVYHATTSLIGCYYAKKMNKPFILTAHDLIIPDDLPISAKLFKKIYDKTFGRFLIKNSTMLIALTEDQIEQYILRGANLDKIKIIPNGIDLEKYIVNEKLERTCNTEKCLLFVGRIDKYKGIQDIIEMMPKVLNEYPKTKFIVVGRDYGYKDELTKTIRSNIEDNVIFVENISDEELICLYRKSDIFVFPSKMEGFGIVILEAMAAGTLCIAYSIPSVRTVIKNKENGILVDNKSKFLDNILYYLRNFNEKVKIERHALDYVKNYDIKNIVTMLENAYTEMIK